MKKLIAYTLVEILVALVITSIIIVMALNLYFQLSQTNRRIIRDYDKNAELLQLKSVLNMDFERYDNIEYSIYELNFYNRTGKCNYEFTDFGILRKYREKIDTFKLEYSDLEYELQNGNTGMLIQLSFNIKYHNEKLPFTFYKDYLNENSVNKVVFR